MARALALRWVMVGMYSYPVVPIARELVDGAFIPMHLLCQDLETPVHEGMHIFRIEGPGQRAETHDVGKQHRDLLALAFQGAAHGQDLVGQVPRRVGL